MIPASSFFGDPTRGGIGYAAISSAGYGTRKLCNSSPVFPGSSQADDVEVRLAEQASGAVAPATASPRSTNARKACTAKTQTGDVDSIAKRLTKLKPTKRAAAVNSIKAMFQFDEPISDEAANKILEDLRRRGTLTIDAADRIQVRGR
jgi:hypothetical protein